MHAFLSNLANRQTDIQTNSGVRTKTYTSSVVGGKKTDKLLKKHSSTLLQETAEFMQILLILKSSNVRSPVCLDQR